MKNEASPDNPAEETICRPEAEETARLMKADSSGEFAASEQRWIREHLSVLFDSTAFRSSPRSKEFLAYIVEQTLAGQDEALKERSIGTEVFHRSPDYPTGDDPVVRVTARDVRRRLTRYYSECAGDAGTVRIELPVGSYKPEFHWTPEANRLPIEEPEADTPSEPESVTVMHPAIPSRRPWWTLLAVVIFVLAAGWIWLNRTRTAPHTPADLFWAPVLASPQPVLVCLNSPVVYQPSLDLYRRYSGPNAQRYATESQRIRHPLELPPNTPLQWGDMRATSNFYVANGDAYAGASLSTLFARLHKSSELHIGSGCSSQDLRYSPAILVGALNNEWTLRLTSHLPFRFTQENNRGQIEDAAHPTQRWGQHWDSSGDFDRDYGVVSRLFDSQTGQLVIVVAGIGPEGTRAVSDLITSSSSLSRALRTAPSGWEKEDLQMVFSAPIVDGVPGKPALVAARFWPVQ